METGGKVGERACGGGSGVVGDVGCDAASVGIKRPMMSNPTCPWALVASIGMTALVAAAAFAVASGVISCLELDGVPLCPSAARNPWRRCVDRRLVMSPPGCAMGEVRSAFWAGRGALVEGPGTAGVLSSSVGGAACRRAGVSS